MLLFLLAFTATAAPKPNVIIILADDLGGHDLGCYGSTFHQTPHLDALAKRGMRFTNAYSASPLCSPTRSSILTGLAPARTGITAPVCHVKEVVLEKKLSPLNAKTKVANAASVTRLETRYTTLAEVLRDSGYRTAHFGKWHLGPEPYSPLQQGFEVDLPHTPGPGPGGANGYLGPWDFWKGEGAKGEHIEDRMASEAVKFMRAHKDEPFYLNYWAFSVHSPWMSKEAYAKEAEPRADPQSGQRNPMYAAMIRSLDEAVGTLTAALDDLGLMQNTILIFSSDNGGWHNKPKATRMTAYADIPVTSNAPFRSGKASNYEGGTHVPLLIVWPAQIKPSSVTDAIAQSTDFFPTLLDLLALPKPADIPFDGQSIAPALRGEAFQHAPIFCHFPHGGDVPAQDIPGFKPATWVRRGDHKLIRFFADNDDGYDRLELYDLSTDPSEAQNLATAQPQLTTELNALITDYLQRTQAVVPTRNPNYGKAKAEPADPLQGWKARACTATVKDGVVHVSKLAKDTFLGFSAARHSGPTTVTLRLKAQPGSAHIHWLPGGVGSAASTVPYTTSSSTDWQEIKVDLPAQAALGIVRVYLPAQATDIEIDAIELQSKSGKVTRTEF